MRKRMTAMILALVLIVSAIPVSAGQWLDANGAQQYRMVLDNLFKTYPPRYREDAQGTLYAGLMDMNADGSPELVTAWHNPDYQTASREDTKLHLDIYTLKSGKAVKTLGYVVEMWNGETVVSVITRGGKRLLECVYANNRSSSRVETIGMNGLIDVVEDWENPQNADTGIWIAVGGGFHDWSWEINTETAAAAQALRDQLVTIGGTPCKLTASAITLDGAALSLPAYLIDGSNYFKLRDLAKVLNGTQKQFDVSYDSKAQRIDLLPGQPYTPVGGELAAGKEATAAQKSGQSVSLNGGALSLSAYLIDGNNYFKLRDLAKALDFGVTYDEITGTVGILSTTGYDPNAKPDTGAGADEYAAMDAAQKRSLNVFLSSFSDSSFRVGKSGGVVQGFPASDLVDFAYIYNARHTDNVTFSDDYLTAYLSADVVDATLIGFFGFTVQHASGGGYTYANGKYSCPAATGEGAALSIASAYAPLPDGSYQVQFTVYEPDGPELPLDYDCYALSTTQADQSSDLLRRYTGTAIVRPATVDDGLSWHLISYHTK